MTLLRLRILELPGLELLLTSKRLKTDPRDVSVPGELLLFRLYFLQLLEYVLFHEIRAEFKSANERNAITDSGHAVEG